MISGIWKVDAMDVITRSDKEISNLMGCIPVSSNILWACNAQVHILVWQFLEYSKFLFFFFFAMDHPVWMLSAHQSMIFLFI
jgi:hypothetical protein